MAPPPSLFALASPPSTPSQTGAPPEGEGAVYLLLSPPSSTTYLHPTNTAPYPPQPTSPASTVVINNDAVTDADKKNGDNDGGELDKSAGIGIKHFPTLLIPESALPTFPLYLPLTLLLPPSFSIVSVLTIVPNVTDVVIFVVVIIVAAAAIVYAKVCENVIDEFLIKIKNPSQQQARQLNIYLRWTELSSQRRVKQNYFIQHWLEFFNCAKYPEKHSAHNYSFIH